ncbi:MAG: sporulation protein YabP [Clostridia bacterium]|nr:sporulation protein YabP [Clostridia bacterium]MBR6604045.1 sporulation protein YabP [Clostridia bacterium]
MNEQANKHDILIRSREYIEICGVETVVSFDEESVCLESVMGELLIEGEELNVGTLDTDKGVVKLTGKINGIYYNTSTPKPQKGFFGRLMG